MGSGFQVRLLKRFFPSAPLSNSGAAYAGKSKLAILMGPGFFAEIAGKMVIDFGCGEGDDSIEMVRRGAGRVIGIDIRNDVLNVARQKADEERIGPQCSFATSTNELADVIVSVDAFEHFSDPAEILRIMYHLLKPSGAVLISFGPTWYHPLGGHLFSVFPWAHLLFAEEALIEWRSTFKTDGATRFGEVAGGLNQMTIARFEALVAGSLFRIDSLELVPIRKVRRFHNRLTREFSTSIVRCRLLKG
jgi:SAM-dependent methyltransferase